MWWTECLVTFMKRVHANRNKFIVQLDFNPSAYTELDLMELN